MKYSNNSSNKINILLIGFNRSDLISKSIKRLKKIDEAELWISIDGPRKYNQKDLIEINKIKEICFIEKIPKKNYKFNKKNLGCRKGVIDAISWFFSKVNYGLIIEDDIELDKDYIFQINFFLKKYSKEKRISSISSHNSINYPEKLRANQDFYLMPFCRVWGWATWKDRWENHIKLTKKLEEFSLIRIFFTTPIKYRKFNTALIIWKCVNNKFDTWDFEWNYFHILNNHKSITPKGFHILNHGFSKDATHTTMGKPPWTQMDKFKFCDKQIIDIKETINFNLEKFISSECGLPIQENYLLEVVRLIAYYFKKYIKIFINFFISIRFNLNRNKI